MAPGSNNHNNNNNNNRQTGAKPKTKSSKKNSVPREVVAPTRRDLQQLNVLVDWATSSGAAAAAVNNQQQQQNLHQQPGPSGVGGGGSSHQQNFLLKPRNNRTPGEGTCYEIDNLTLQDNSRYIPAVRPIVRRNLLSESGSGAESGELHNTAVGVVIPTTPNSALQSFRLNDTSGGPSTSSGAGTSNINNNLLNNSAARNVLNPFHQLQQQQSSQQQQQSSQLRASPLSSRVPDGASQNQLNLNKNSNQQQQQIHHHHHHGGAVGGAKANNFEDKLSQIQEYIKLTTNLISSVQIDNLNGPRPQSVQSIQSTTTHSATPVQTPSYDDLRYRMENQNKNMQALKEQQAHLLRLQQAARQQLADMEAMRAQTAQPVQLENFESVEQVQEGIGGIMERMRVLSTFIQNQQELGNMLGGGADNDDVLSEQVALQQKFAELRDKKAQMHSLVSELQNLNVEASRQFDGQAAGVERNVPIELTNAPATAADMRKATKTFINQSQNVNQGEVMNGGSRGGSMTPKVENVVDGGSEEGLDEEEAEAIAGTADMLNDKINEINAMKSQLRRLKEMMDTVKLMEMKTGGSIDEDEEDAPEENDENPEDEEESVENSRSPSVASQISDQQQGAGGGASAVDESRREQLNQRVEALHAMTRDLREQAKSIAAERDALKNARSELQKRRNNVAELQNQADSQAAEKLTNHVASYVTSSAGATSSKEMALKAELEQKKRELEQIAKMTQSMKKNTELSRRNTEVTTAQPKVSSVSSADSLRSQSHPPVIPPPPSASAVNNTSASNATNLSKHSADSGVTDIFANAHLESGSYQSSSTRSLNMVPPMPDICNRADRYHHRKSEDVGTSTGRNERTSPWPSHLFAGAGPSSSNTGPQSPHFHPSFGVGSDIHSSYPAYSGYPTYANLLPPHTPNSAPAPPPDPLMFQHFMQTQQMLMNSITQCNQLLWIQQREINNLNNAVLLLQERILNSGHGGILTESHVPPSNGHIRAESTPPNNSLSSNPSAIYSRARSEQPSMQQFFTPTTTATSQFSVNAQIQRNNSNITRNYRNLRHVNINTANNAIYEQQQQQQPNSLYDHHNFMTQNGTASSANEEQQTYNNGGPVGGGNLGPSNMINNLANGPPTAAPACMNNLNNSNANSSNVQQALNNQVLPGVRANNYWDNFRSYSRQNLLSSNSCKSNEDSCALGGGGGGGSTSTAHGSGGGANNGGGPALPVGGAATGSGSGNCTNNINNQIQQRNNSNVMNNNYGSGSTSSNKYPPNFNRNNSFSNINQQQQQLDVGPNLQQPSCGSHQHYQSMPPEAAASSGSFQMSQSAFVHQQQVQQQQQQVQPHHTPLNQSSSFDLGELQFHTNPINLGLANKSGHPKGSAHKKYPLSLRSCRDANLAAAGEGSSNFYGVGAHAEMVSDLNLASASNYQHDSKSTSKLFEALKENVYQEVKNLITANESRPHFLIQLFRELQLISSDPLRQRTLQSIQELYNRYIESTLAQQQQQQGGDVQQQLQDGGGVHVNNVGSNNLLSSGANEPVAGPSSQLAAENVEVVDMEVTQNYTNVRQQAQQQGFAFVPSAESTPIAGGSAKERDRNDLGLPSSEIINIIMGDIVGVINSVDYINDSVLYKIAGVICNHATGASNGLFHYQQQQQLPQQDQDRILGNPMLGPSMAAFLAQNDSDVISQEDFLRHLESWNRTDKDEFISNLENLLNNILLRSSAAEGDSAAVSSSNLNGDEEAQMRAQQQQHQHQHDSTLSAGDVSTDNNETFNPSENPFSPPGVVTAAAAVPLSLTRRVYGPVASSTSESDKMSNGGGGVSSSNGYASTTYDLAEADQICDTSLPGAGGAVGGAQPVAGPSGSSAGGVVGQEGFEDRWRVMQKKLDDDLADIIERNRNAERVAQEQQQQDQRHQQQQQQRRSNEGWQDEDGEGNLDPEEQLPIFY
ncbi:hypothetical protein quinque_006401 [Culex quinquefasciatus]